MMLGVLGGVSVVLAGMFWMPGFSASSRTAAEREAEWDREHKTDPYELPRPYSVPESVDELCALEPGEIRARLGTGTLTCLLKEPYGCLLLYENICFLDRGTANQPRVPHKAMCPVYVRAASAVAEHDEK